MDYEKFGNKARSQLRSNTIVDVKETEIQDGLNDKDGGRDHQPGIHFAASHEEFEKLLREERIYDHNKRTRGHEADIYYRTTRKGIEGDEIHHDVRAREGIDSQEFDREEGESKENINTILGRDDMLREAYEIPGNVTSTGAEEFLRVGITRHSFTIGAYGIKFVAIIILVAVIFARKSQISRHRRLGIQ